MSQVLAFLRGFVSLFRRWPDPLSGRSAFGRLSSSQLTGVIDRNQASQKEQA